MRALLIGGEAEPLAFFSLFCRLLPTFSRACCFRRAGFDAQVADAFARALDSLLQGVF